MLLVIRNLDFIRRTADLTRAQLLHLRDASSEGKGCQKKKTARRV
jgi:hypothetical protein